MRTMTPKCANCRKKITHNALHYWDYTGNPKEVWFCSEECLDMYNFGKTGLKHRKKEAKS